MEAVPVAKPATFDPTDTPGIGLLDEMSLAELKERLAQLKQRAEQERLTKRESIVQSKVGATAPDWAGYGGCCAV